MSSVRKYAVFFLIVFQAITPVFNVSYAQQEKPSLSLREKVFNAQTQAQEELSTRRQEKAAVAATRYSALLQSEQPSRNMQSMLQQQAGSMAGSAIETWLSQFGTARVDLSSDRQFSIEGSQADLLLPLIDTGNSLFFTQNGIRRVEERTMMNAGIGLRHWFEKSMLGANLFYDRDFSHEHTRAGVGLEYARDYMKVSVNGYQRLSDWKTSPDDRDWLERPANGFDIRSEAWLPSLPQLGGKLVYAHYYGDEVGVFGRHDRQKNPSVLSAGLSYSPVPLVTFSAEHSISAGTGANDTRIGVGLSYAFGVPLSSQLDPDALAARRLMSGRRYDLVDRNNVIVLEYKQKKMLSLGLPSALSGEEQTLLPLQVSLTSRQDSIGIEWQGAEFFAAGGDVIYGAEGYTAVLPEWQEEAPNQYTLTAVAWDVKGNASKPGKITITVLPKAVKISLAGDITEEEGETIALGLNARMQYSVAKVEWDAKAFIAAGGKIQQQKSRSTSNTGLNYFATLPAYRAGESNQYPLKVTVWDSEGNASNVASATLTVTAKALTVVLASEISGQEGATAAIDIDITAKNGLDRIEWQADAFRAAGGSFVEKNGKYSALLPAWQEGKINTYPVSAIAVDKKGRKSNPAEATIAVSSRAINLVPVADLAGEENSTLTVIPDITAVNGVARIEFKAAELLAAGGKIEVNGKTQLSVHLPAWHSGQSNRYGVRIQAFDTRGYASAPVTFNVAVNPVAVTLSLPASMTAKELETIALAATVNAAKGIDRLEITAEAFIAAGGAIKGTGENYSLTLPAYQPQRENKYPLSVIAWDRSGNASAPASTLVVVEPQPVSLELGDNLTVTEKSTQTLTAQVKSHFGLDRIEWTAAEFLAAGGKIAPAGEQAVLTVPGFVVGGKNTYTLTAKARDNNGMASAPATLQVVVVSAVMGAESQCDVLGGGTGYRNVIDKSSVNYREATDYESLRALVNSGEKYIYIPNDVTIEIPNKTTALAVKNGTTIFSDRGLNGSQGGLLRVAYTTEDANKYPVITMQSHSRLTGLRYEGPYKGTVTNNQTIGIQTVPNSQNVEVDNMELWGWPWSAVNVKKTLNARVHHNFIHDNIRAGLGYGIVTQNGNSTAEIACNVFNANRHAIAGQGAPGEGYSAHHNLILNGGGMGAYHQFDMHDDPDAEGNLIGGEFLDIRYNLFDFGRWGTMVRTSILVRAQPTRGPAIVEDNWFSQPWSTGGTKQVGGRYGSWIPTEQEILDSNQFSIPMDYYNRGSGQCVVDWLSYSQGVNCESLGM